MVVLNTPSSGIGEATARRLARTGAHVVLGARRTDRLERLTVAIRAEGGSAHYRALDVTSLDRRARPPLRDRPRLREHSQETWRA